MYLSRATITRAGFLTRPPKVCYSRLWALPCFTRFRCLDEGGGDLATATSRDATNVLQLSSTKQQTRQLTLHGHHTQELLRSHGVPVPRAILAQTPLEARDAVKTLGKSCVLRAQVLHGDLDKLLFENGLRGGIQAVDNPEQGLDMAARMLNRQAISENMRHRSLTVNQLLVSEQLAHEEQWYLAMTIDREKYCLTVIISKCDEDSRKGDVTWKNISGKGTSFAFGFSQGITDELVSRISRHIGVPDEDTTNLDDILSKAYRIFKETDATLLEISPLARLSSGLFTCLDARLVVDDDAAHRQPDLFRLRDTSQEVQDEVRAEQHNLVYIKLTGNIGNIVNGAGLAMATNDAIGLHGGASANFLDAGGQATKETMIQALGIVLGDERVKAILINVYGGITRCDMIAESIIGAAQEMTLAVPLVVRLQGTNSAQGLKLLADADLGLHVESDFGRAAQKAVQLAGNCS
ncbi:Succinyl-CoA ligase subunit beta [Trichoderma ghanense]|uniref:Succinyl-CoA ligase subunit beta n=1 Tax=Trichoderma ghanense TaxID=65468 RepID=A0ABY2GUV1_9HYPO